ncbi:1-phosphofructokinase [Haloterrigena turkmenica DSM 5511]|uniref:1-phosphofructokinase n=1 Tax=Haloterrigena turkmenica (strain ATCC 51198 / DSM 5511 / JCM 9101 / NCIMB 13204 / VKM B-1734 / 4k) TaxID=543526 RepID=D2RXA9_HALTV|nr:1-phosphofructokinase [Haloterrigena turkmenica]ADB61633.1 1-phosphofructokinase [Haloterrigena turkmenica DSM 5511]
MIASVTLNPAVDYTVELSEPLTDGAVARSDEHRYDAGGKGINVSKYLAELGVETVATGVAGGFLGRSLLERLSATSIDADFVEIDGETRLNTTLLGPDGEYKVNQNGPQVAPSAIEEIVDTLQGHDPETVVIAGSLPPGTGPETIDRVAAAGPWETVVDVGGATLADLEAEYALCKPNHEELAAATGRRVDDVQSAIAAAEELQAAGFERVVASLGADGAIMATPDRTLHAPAADVDVVDTVGAGDALLSGVLAARARQESDAVALRSGVAVASRVVAVSGTRAPSLTGLRDERESISVSAY